MTLQNRTKDFDDFVAQHRGLAILKALHGQTGYGTNEEVVAHWLDHLKLGASRSIIRQELERLRELQVVKTEMRGNAGDVMVFWLTERGLDYLEFRTSIESLPRIGPETSPY